MLSLSGISHPQNLIPGAIEQYTQHSNYGSAGVYESGSLLSFTARIIFS